MITAYIGREAFEALQAGREPCPKLTRKKVFDDDVMVIIPAKPATREGCDYVVSDGKLCPKCGHVHRAATIMSLVETLADTAYSNGHEAGAIRDYVSRANEVPIEEAIRAVLAEAP